MNRTHCTANGTSCTGCRTNTSHRRILRQQPPTAAAARQQGTSTRAFDQYNLTRLGKSIKRKEEVQMYQQVMHRGLLGWDGMQSVLRVIGSALRRRNTLSHAAAPAFEMHARTHAHAHGVAGYFSVCVTRIYYMWCCLLLFLPPAERTSKQRAAQFNAARRPYGPTASRNVRTDEAMVSPRQGSKYTPSTSPTPWCTVVCVVHSGESLLQQHPSWEREKCVVGGGGGGDDISAASAHDRSSARAHRRPDLLLGADAGKLTAPSVQHGCVQARCCCCFSDAQLCTTHHIFYISANIFTKAGKVGVFSAAHQPRR